MVVERGYSADVFLINLALLVSVYNLTPVCISHALMELLDVLSG